jgi:hypothetical protein
MSPLAHFQSRSIGERSCIIGFGVGVAASLTLKYMLGALRMSDGYALRLPGENFWQLIVVLCGLSAVLLVVVLGIVGAIYFLKKSRPFALMYFIGLCLVFGTYCFYDGPEYLDGVRARLLSVDEARYLEFARQVRATLGKEDIPYADLRDLEYSGRDSAKRNAEKFLEIVKTSEFADWPRWLLQVDVRDDRVILSRGSGMLGKMGVEIFDKGPVPEPEGLNSPRENSYLPVEYVLSPKVFLYTSD